MEAILKREQGNVENAVRKRKMSWKRFIPLYMMMIPGLVYMIINNFVPMLGAIIAFKEVDYSKGILSSEWVGFKNFEFLFSTSDAYIITRNTLLYNAGFIVLNLIFAVALAILLNEVSRKILSRFYQSVVLLPHLISSVIIGYLVFALLSVDGGFINKSILPLLHIQPIDWYSKPDFWPYILSIVNLWKNTGYLCVIYLAAVIGIDPEYYEAAKVDGASKWKQIRHVTLPLIAPVITIMTLLQIGRIFYSDFGLFYQVPLDAGALMSTTNVIDTYVYRSFLMLGDIGMSSAAGLYQSLCGFILILGANLLVRKFNKDSALF